MRVLVMMSGGVDSSVAAFLLKKQGFDVTGVTLNLFSENESAANKVLCCGSDAGALDAKACARIMGISHHVLNEQETFKKYVINKFKDSYLAGETPNPCIECNRHVKFGKILEMAKAFGCDAVATGHYARIEDTDGRKSLFKGKDPKKDQSYFLYMLTEVQLAGIMFPLGDLTKDKVRSIAGNIGLPVVHKPESQDVCFVKAGDYRELFNKSAKEGNIIEKSTGRVLGRHGGFHNYTIGQREGLGVAVGEPLYVANIDTMTNTLYVGKLKEVMALEIRVSDLSWVHPSLIPQFPGLIEVKVRYRSPAALANIELIDENTCRVIFKEPQFAPTPGQFAVFYNRDEVLGGGKIIKNDVAMRR
ncbi:tRNA 2-thiouridine(34) synthase MnmA [Elusimicrobiota bacterium]